jgi:hypothetical protein
MQKVVAIGIGVLIAVFTMGSMVEAATGTISGTSCTSCVCFSCTTGAVVSCTNSTAWKTCNAKRCSIGVESLLKALGNLGSGPNNEEAANRVTVFLQEVHLQCRNKAGNATPANGQPFIGEVVLTANDFIEPATVDQNGKALSNIGFLDGVILAAIGITSTEDLCPNRNWTVKPLVTKMRVLGELFYDPDPANNGDNCVLEGDPNNFDFTGCSLRDALSVQCSAPAGAVAGTEFTYVGASGVPPCDTLCHNDAGTFCDANGLPAVQ